MKSPRIKPADHPTGAQLRAARGLINMSVLDLSERSRVSPNTVKRAESAMGPAPVNAASAKIMVTILEAAGVTFLPADEQSGAGVRLALVDPDHLSRRRPKSST